jgi:hypothetical protein
VKITYHRHLFLVLETKGDLPKTVVVVVVEVVTKEVVKDGLVEE